MWRKVYVDLMHYEGDGELTVKNIEFINNVKLVKGVVVVHTTPKEMNFYEVDENLQLVHVLAQQDCPKQVCISSTHGKHRGSLIMHCGFQPQT